MDVNVKSVPVEYGLEWLKGAWKVAKNNYGLVLVVAITIGLVNFASNKIPFVGSIFTSVISLCLGVGQIYLCSKLVKGETAKYSDLFYLFNNTQLLNKFVPLIIISVVLTLPVSIIDFFSKNSSSQDLIYYISLFVGLIVTFTLSLLISFSSPLILFKNLKFSETINYSFSALSKNLLPILFCLFLSIVLMVVSMLMLLLPFIFITLPIFCCLYYIVYATIFEDLELPAGIPEIKNQPTI